MFRCFSYLVIILFVAAYALPLYVALVTSFKTNAQIAKSGYMSVPAQPTLENYVAAVNDLNLFSTYLLTAFITVCSIAGSLLLTAMAGYAFAFLKFKWNYALFVIFVSGMFVPFQIAIIPMYYASIITGLYDTPYAQIFAHVGWTIPIGTLVLRNYFKTIPNDIVSASRVDGLTNAGIFTRIVMPLARPAVGVLVVMEFTWIWNTFIWGLVLSSEQHAVPIMVMLLSRMINPYYITWGRQAAGVILAALPGVGRLPSIPEIFRTRLDDGRD